MFAMYSDLELNCLSCQTNFKVSDAEQHVEACSKMC